MYECTYECREEKERKKDLPHQHIFYHSEWTPSPLASLTSSFLICSRMIYGLVLLPFGLLLYAVARSLAHWEVDSPQIMHKQYKKAGSQKTFP